MICALLLGREGSQGFPGKNVTNVLGAPLVSYPIRAALGASLIDRVYVSTDSPTIKDIATELGAEVIDRPAELATSASLSDDSYIHGYRTVCDRFPNDPPTIVVCLFANAATVTSETLDKGIRVLQENAEYDSAATVSAYNMWSPLRARRIGSDGLLHPFVPFEALGDPESFNCDRDSQGDAWFADMGACIIKARCLENIESGLLPQKWLGRRIYPLKQWGGLDVDYEWQMPQVEFWLRAHGLGQTPSKAVDERDAGTKKESPQ